MNIISKFSNNKQNQKVNEAKRNKNLSVKTFLSKHTFDISGLFVLAIIITFMYPSGKSFQFADLKEGRVYMGPEIIAPFTFPVNKSKEEYANDLEIAKESVPPVFHLYEQIAEQQQEKLTQFLDQLEILVPKPNSTREQFEKLFNENGIVLSEEDVNLLWSGFTDIKANQIEPPLPKKIVQNRVAVIESISVAIVQVVKEMYSAGILDVDKSNFSQSIDKISIGRSKEDGVEELEDINFFQGLTESKNTLLEKLRQVPGLDEREIKIGYQIAVDFLGPNYIYAQEEHRERIEDAVANVPLAKDQVLAGERIIDSHQRVTKQHIEKLNSLAIAKAERGETSGFLSQLLPGIGKFLITLSILSILSIFLWRERPEITYNGKQMLLFGLVILSIALFTFLVNRLDLSAFLIPIVMGTIIVTIFFDALVGFVTAFVLSLLVGALRGNEYGILFVSVFVSTIAILTVSKVRTRNWVLHSIAATIVAYVFAITIHDFLSYTPFTGIAQNWMWGIANGFFAPIFAYGLVIIFEFTFDMTTDMTLLELSDLNQPLLRQLAMRAPGTYHHSIVVGNLAEAATESIGGNALLARVGAYYHDIGKMEKPEYFVENQTKGRNPQEKLTPTMSSLVLLNHVRKGADMAKGHGLPPEIEDFIYQHHGTGLMNYFYQKALEKSGEESLSQTEFRYPGPRPKKRETAIVMLADAVEAKSRTLKDPKPNRIKNMVEEIIDERFKSGELDDSPLTLQDLSKISDAFQKILNGIFHGRIDYPDSKEKIESKSAIKKTEEIKNTKS